MATFFIIKRLVLSRVLATLVMLLMPAEIWRMRKFRERWENTAGWSDDLGRAEDLSERPTRLRQSSDLQRSMGWMRSTPLILWPTPREFTAGARWRYHRLSTQQTSSASTIWQQCARIPSREQKIRGKSATVLSWFSPFWTDKIPLTFPVFFPNFSRVLLMLCCCFF